MSKGRPYFYVRFRWWTSVDLKKTAAELTTMFKVREIPHRRYELEISLYKDERDEVEVRSDTLRARISPFRAILSQDKAAPFTPRDIELRKRVLELYSRDRPIPFLWDFNPEPKFEVDEK